MKNILFLLLLNCSHLAMASADNSNLQQLKQVISDFSNAIKTKDETGFISLFYNHNVVFLGINPAKRTGIKPSQNGLMYATHLGFIGWIVNTEQTTEEKIWNSKIHSDGNIASIYFNYSFHLDGKTINDGAETWSLIKTSNGWKIVSIVFSAQYHN